MSSPSNQQQCQQTRGDETIETASTSAPTAARRGKVAIATAGAGAGDWVNSIGSYSISSSSGVSSILTDSMLTSISSTTSAPSGSGNQKQQQQQQQQPKLVGGSSAESNRNVNECDENEEEVEEEYDQHEGEFIVDDEFEGGLGGGGVIRGDLLEDYVTDMKDGKKLWNSFNEQFLLVTSSTSEGSTMNQADYDGGSDDDDYMDDYEMSDDDDGSVDLDNLVDQMLNQSVQIGLIGSLEVTDDEEDDEEENGDSSLAVKEGEDTGSGSRRRRSRSRKEGVNVGSALHPLIQSAQQTRNEVDEQLKETLEKSLKINLSLHDDNDGAEQGRWEGYNKEGVVDVNNSENGKKEKKKKKVQQCRFCKQVFAVDEKAKKESSLITTLFDDEDEGTASGASKKKGNNANGIVERHNWRMCPKLLPEVKPKVLSPIRDSYAAVRTQYIKDVYNRYKLTNERRLQLQNMLYDIEGKLQECLETRTVKLELFGSTMSGFGTMNSDLDICLSFTDGQIPGGLTLDEMFKRIVNFMKKRRNMFQNPAAVLQARVPILKFRFVSNVFKSCTNGSQLPAAAAVVVNAESSSTDFDDILPRYQRFIFKISISYGNQLAVENTRLLSVYSRIDARLPMLGITLKHLIKCGNMGDATQHGLSSYAYILMLIHYLQRVQPPVLPVLQQINRPIEGSISSHVGDSEWDTYYFSDLNRLLTSSGGREVEVWMVGVTWWSLKLMTIRNRIVSRFGGFVGVSDLVMPAQNFCVNDLRQTMEKRSKQSEHFKCENRQSIGELLAGFFDFYLCQFNVQSNIVQIHDDSSGHSTVNTDNRIMLTVRPKETQWKPTHAAFAIQDPFIHSHNLGNTCNRPNGFRRIMISLMKARLAFGMNPAVQSEMDAVEKDLYAGKWDFERVDQWYTNQIRYVDHRKNPRLDINNRSQQQRHKRSKSGPNFHRNPLPLQNGVVLDHQKPHMPTSAANNNNNGPTIRQQRNASKPRKVSGGNEEMTHNNKNSSRSSYTRLYRPNNRPTPSHQSNDHAAYHTGGGPPKQQQYSNGGGDRPFPRGRAAYRAGGAAGAALGPSNNSKKGSFINDTNTNNNTRRHKSSSRHSSAVHGTGTGTGNYHHRSKSNNGRQPPPPPPVMTPPVTTTDPAAGHQHYNNNHYQSNHNNHNKTAPTFQSSNNNQLRSHHWSPNFLPQHAAAVLNNTNTLTTPMVTTGGGVGVGGGKPPAIPTNYHSAVSTTTATATTRQLPSPSTGQFLMASPQPLPSAHKQQHQQQQRQRHRSQSSKNRRNHSASPIKRFDLTTLNGSTNPIPTNRRNDNTNSNTTSSNIHNHNQSSTSPGGRVVLPPSKFMTTSNSSNNALNDFPSSTKNNRVAATAVSPTAMINSSNKNSGGRPTIQGNTHSAPNNLNRMNSCPDTSTTNTNTNNYIQPGSHHQQYQQQQHRHQHRCQSGANVVPFQTIDDDEWKRGMGSVGSVNVVFPPLHYHQQNNNNNYNGSLKMSQQNSSGNNNNNNNRYHQHHHYQHPNFQHHHHHTPSSSQPPNQHQKILNNNKNMSTTPKPHSYNS